MNNDDTLAGMSTHRFSKHLFAAYLRFICGIFNAKHARVHNWIESDVIVCVCVFTCNKESFLLLLLHFMTPIAIFVGRCFCCCCCCYQVKVNISFNRVHISVVVVRQLLLLLLLLCTTFIYSHRLFVIFSSWFISFWLCTSMRRREKHKNAINQHQITSKQFNEVPY